MTIHFGYDKKEVIQALRYHFLSRPEIRIMLIMVNVFAIGSAIFFYLQKIQAISFLGFSLLWFILMLVIWKLLPASIYKRSATFQDHFTLHIEEENLYLETERGTQGWKWKQFSYFMESPYFFHLYFNARSFFLVPKDSFEGITAIQEIRSILHKKVGKK